MRGTGQILSGGPVKGGAGLVLGLPVLATVGDLLVPALEHVWGGTYVRVNNRGFMCVLV